MTVRRIPGSDCGAAVGFTGAAPQTIERTMARFLVATDVLAAPLWLAVAATRAPAFRYTRCPVALVGPEAWFFVHHGWPVSRELTAVRGVRLIELEDAALSWWIPPESTAGWPGDPGTVQAALLSALRG